MDRIINVIKKNRVWLLGFLFANIMVLILIWN